MSEEEQLSATIIHSIQSIEHLQSDCNMFFNEIGNGLVYNQGVIKTDFDTNAHCVFSIPKPNDGKVFITVSDEHPDVIRNIIANIQDHNDTYPILTGNLMLLDSPYLKSKGVCGVIFVPADVSNILEKLPEEIFFKSKSYRFMLLVFIGEADHAIWKKHGHDALMERFERTDKDLLSFNIVPQI